MTRVFRTGLAVMLGLSVVGVRSRAIADDEKPKALNQAAEAPKAKPADSTASEPPIAEQIAKVRSDYDARVARFREALNKGMSQAERSARSVTWQDTDICMCQLVDLAARAPKEEASRDALIWVIHQPGRSDGGGDVYSDQFSRAVNLLVQHHADDPEVARVGVTLDNSVTYRRDAFLEGIYASAKSREAKGLARLALGVYLARKARDVEFARKNPIPQQVRFQTKGANGKLVERSMDMGNERKGYFVHLRLLDPDAVRTEAERLLEEVIAEYGDIPYITLGRRAMEAELRAKPPATITDPKEKEQMLDLERRLARTKTLAEVAEAKLDEMHNLAVGKPAPEIVGTSVDGKPMKLSDYRGKVIVLVFWGSWCGPCMAQVPHERELVERLKDKPFALLGVDCEKSKETAIETMKANGMTWPNWYDGTQGEGPIVGLYHVQSYPSIFVLDAKGIIRHKRLRGTDLDKAVDDLLKELDAKDSAK